MQRQALIVFLCGIAWASPAGAQEARELFRQGEAAYQTGDYETAVSSWERAYELDARPALQYNLAQAYERLGRLDMAVTAYRVYVDNTPGDDPRAQNARARLASLEQRVGNTSLSLTGGPEGAAIFIDGRDRGRLPHPDPFRVEPGSHRVVIRHPGFTDFVSTVAVSAGQTLEVPVELVAGESGRASTGGGGVSMVGIIVAAAGAAIAAGGAVTGVLALTGAQSAPNSTGGEAEDARTMALVTDILLPVGGVAVALGLVLMFVLDADTGGDTAVVPMLGPDVAGLSVIGAF